MTTLPMADPAAAQAELERCTGLPGHVGVMSYGRSGDRPLDDPANELIVDLEMVVLPYAIGAKQFSFVQIGAHDGAMHDPLRRLVATLGFKGVMVEPQPEPFRRLVERYKGREGLHFENAAIADVDGTKTLYRIRPDAVGVPDSATQLASFDLILDLLERKLHVS